MINYQPGDLILVAFPFSGGGKAKIRPAMIIVDTGDADVLVARVTTQSGQAEPDVPIKDWRAAGLLAPSTVRLHKLATLEKSLVHRRLGSVQVADRTAIAANLHRIYGDWRAP
jgi:mRNA interferase MazF